MAFPRHDVRTGHIWQTICMEITGLHLLLTYQCNFECDHCFVWGSERQTGTMTTRDIELILDQATDTGTVEWIYFEGGEPFLHYDTLLSGVQAAAVAGFKTGIVTNAAWADSVEQARRLREIFEGYDPDAHPVTGPLLRGGPAELARANDVTCRPGYADACHLCYETRRHLRQRYPEELAPGQVYGVI